MQKIQKLCTTFAAVNYISKPSTTMKKLKNIFHSMREGVEWRLMTKHFVVYGYLIILIIALSDLFKKVFEKKK